MAVFDDLLILLRLSLNVKNMSGEDIKKELEKINKKDICSGGLSESAIKNSVAGLIYDTVSEYLELPEAEINNISKYAVMICRYNYKMLVIEKQMTALFKAAGIPFCVMKGMAAAADFPVPDLRKAGDIDILLTNPSDAERAVKEIEKLGFFKESEQHSLHHISMMHSNGMEIEVHTMLAEPFDNVRINEYIERLVPECGRHTIQKEIMGVELPVLEDGYHAYELLLHMLQHFLRAGFGVKLLCDWVVLWNRGLDENSKQTYLRLVEESGIKGFSDMITRVCIKYLGLKRENVLWMKPFDSKRSREEIEHETELFMEELMDAEEFGKAKNRMVALRGTGIFAYIREFHHQMHLNFPKAGKCFLLWPVLWIITLIRFLRNNRKVRNVSGKELLKNAGKRGKLVEGLKLFK